MENQEFCIVLRNYKEELGLTDRALGELMDPPHGRHAINNWVNCHALPANLDTIDSLACALAQATSDRARENLTEEQRVAIEDNLFEHLKTVWESTRLRRQNERHQELEIEPFVPSSPLQMIPRAAYIFLWLFVGLLLNLLLNQGVQVDNPIGLFLYALLITLPIIFALLTLHRVESGFPRFTIPRKEAFQIGLLLVGAITLGTLGLAFFWPFSTLPQNLSLARISHTYVWSGLISIALFVYVYRFIPSIRSKPGVAIAWVLGLPLSIIAFSLPGLLLLNRLPVETLDWQLQWDIVVGIGLRLGLATAFSYIAKLWLDDINRG